MFFNQYTWDTALTWGDVLHQWEFMIMSFYSVVRSLEKFGFKWEEIEMVPQEQFFWVQNCCCFAQQEFYITEHPLSFLRKQKAAFHCCK